MNIFIGLLILIWWVVMMYFSSQLAQFGRVERAEKHLWSTKAMYAMMWFIFVIIGFMGIFWFVNFKSENNNHFWNVSAIK